MAVMAAEKDLFITPPCWSDAVATRLQWQRVHRAGPVRLNRCCHPGNQAHPGKEYLKYCTGRTRFKGLKNYQCDTVALRLPSNDRPKAPVNHPFAIEWHSVGLGPPCGDRCVHTTG